MATGDKAALRREMKRRRESLDPDRRKACSAGVAENVMAIPEMRNARCVGVYLADAVEVETDAIIEECWHAGVVVCVPVWRETSGSWEWMRMDRNTTRRQGPFGVPEPAGTETIAPDVPDLVLVPGLAFDVSGMRLGRGGGHYDSMLGPGSRCRAVRVGLAFDFQMVERVPAEARDVGMDVVVTEKRILRTTGGPGGRVTERG